MRELCIRLFGGFEMGGVGGSSPTFATRRSRDIFCFLTLNQGRLFSRDHLCGIFWEDDSQDVARKGLRTGLWRIRRALDEIGVEPERALESDDHRIGVPDSTPFWVDIREFEKDTRILRAVSPPELTPGRAHALGRATELYRGDLLDGIYGRWCSHDRERLRLVFLTALEGLMSYHRRRREWWSAIARGREALRHDPLREHVHRELMWCHYAMGNRPAAVAQFRECAEVLRRELEIRPMPETQALHRWILDSRPITPVLGRWDEDLGPADWIRSLGGGSELRFHVPPSGGRPD